MPSPPAQIAGSDEDDDGFGFTSDELDVIMARWERPAPEPEPQVEAEHAPAPAPIREFGRSDSNIFDDEMLAAADAVDASFQRQQLASPAQAQAQAQVQQLPARSDSIVLDSDLYDDAMLAAADAAEANYRQQQRAALARPPAHVHVQRSLAQLARSDSIVLDSDLYDDAAMLAAADAAEISYRQELEQQQQQGQQGLARQEAQEQQQQEEQAQLEPTPVAHAAAPAPSTPPRRKALLALPASSPPPQTLPSSSPVASLVRKRKASRSHSRSQSRSPRKRRRVHDAAVNKLVEEVQCPICFEHIAEPHTCAPCGHSACAPCLNAWLTTKRSSNARVKYECPVCRCPIALAGTQLVPNFTLKHVADAMLPLLPADRQQSYHQRTAAWSGEWTYLPAEQPLFLPDSDEDDTDDADDTDDDDEGAVESQLVSFISAIQNAAQQQAPSRRNSEVIDLT